MILEQRRLKFSVASAVATATAATATITVTTAAATATTITAEKEIYRMLGMLQENAASALLAANSDLSVDDAPGEAPPLVIPPTPSKTVEEINGELFG